MICILSLGWYGGAGVRFAVRDGTFVNQLAPSIRACKVARKAAEASHRVLLGSRGSIAVPKLAEHSHRGFQLVYIGTAKTAPRADSLRPLKQQRKKRRWEARRKAQELSEALHNAPWSPIFLEDYHAKPAELAQDIMQAFAQAREGTQRVLIVDGGNTYWLWYHAQKAGLQAALELVKAQHPFIYLGLSAGAILAGRTCRTADWKGWDDPT
eukprot:4132990-Amphidinium_carterae.2